MNLRQVAGRHSSYGTQFWKNPVKKSLSRRELKVRESKKAVNRRLVIPLDNAHWMRALEVLNAKYARPGRTPEHFQTVLRLIVQESEKHPPPNITAIDKVRDAAYDGTIPTSVGLWQTFVWAYAQLDAPDEGMESFLQAQKREKLSAVTLHQMAVLLFPVMCHHGRLTEAKQLLQEYILKENVRHANGSPIHISQQERIGFYRLLSEAAARSGQWREALATLEMCSPSPSPLPTAPTPPSVNALFQERGVPLETNPTASSTPEEKDNHPLRESTLSTVSPATLRSLLSSFSDQGERALTVFKVLHGDWQWCGGTAKEVPDIREVLTLANALGSSGMWEELLDLFCSIYLQRPASYYLATEPSTETFNASDTDNSGHSLHETTPPMREEFLNMVFAAFPVRDPSPESLIPEYEHPLAMVRLMDDLLWEREDVHLSDLVLSRVAAALVQLGEAKRALHLLKQAPLFQSNQKKKYESALEKETRRELVHLIYYLHGLSIETMCFTLQHFPFLFPPETFAQLPPLDQLPAYFREIAKERQDEWREKEAIRLKSDEERLALIDRQKKDRPLIRSRRDYFAHTRSTSDLTEAMDERIKHSLQLWSGQHPHSASPVSFVGDADKDPRPVPKGLHDPASGWNYMGRGGEMVFSNSKKTAHPLSMWPKVMRSLGNPYRGWSPKLNSSHAHRENVLKWNGRSAV